MTEISFVASADLFPFASQWFDSSAGRIHYIDEGSGPPILFLHGNPTWSFLYRHLVGELRDSFRCVACDYPGFGLSDRPEGYGYTAAEHATVVGELVDHLGLEDFIVMGQDWGGPIGSRVAADRAERVRGLVYGNTWLWPNYRFLTRLFSRVMGSSFFQRRILERNYFVEKIIPRVTSRGLSEAEMDHYRKAQPSPEARLGVAEFPKQLLDAEEWLTILESDVKANLASKPVVVVWGLKDPAFPRSYISRIQSMFRDVEVVTLAGASHFIQEDAPEEIAAAIRKRFT